MSFEAMAWAIKQKVGNTTAKFVLLMVANYADEEGRAWPSQDKLAEGIEASRHTVMRALDYLEETGILTRERRHRADGSRATDVIRLDLSRNLQRSKMHEPMSQIATAEPITEPIRPLKEGAREGNREGRPPPDEKAPSSPAHGGGSVEASMSGQAGNSKKGSRVPEDFQPDQTAVEVATRVGLQDELSEIVHNFRDYWRAKPGKDGVKLDWQATFRNWLRNEAQYRNRRNHHVGQTQPHRTQRTIPPGEPSSLSERFELLRRAIREEARALEA